MGSVPWSVFLGAFVDELLRLGVEDVVVSPGSRSTPLAMVFDRSDFRVRVDVDERGAAFFALGLAKASRLPVCLVCTSGTAAANYYPAICEAFAARVPLLVLTADRPHTMRGLGATQTTDQLKMYGDMTAFFHEMPLPDGSPEKIAFARQIARESVIRATGTPMGVAHLNFPFAEPLVPDLSVPELFSAGRAAEAPVLLRPRRSLQPEIVERLNTAIAGKRGVILCGEGDYPPEILGLAKRLGFPVLADPLSNLRRFTDAAIVDNYDNVFRREDMPPIEAVVRFGQYPVSKACFSKLNSLRPLTVVVDEVESRDFNHLTDVFVAAESADFILASGELRNDIGSEYLETWAALNDRERSKIEGAREDSGCEGRYVMPLIDGIREGSLLFSANSMAIRYLDTFYLKAEKALHVMCNRGLNGIDGTLSTALGAAQRFETSTLLTGDLAFLHDINALYLRRELDTNLTVVLLNNNGGGIFEMLPQKSDEPYFERLFLTPHGADFSAIAAGFGVPHVRVSDPEGFAEAYRDAQSRPGIEIIEVRTALSDVKECYVRYC
ncbi:MAG: 2-succinyl-5-enolpyruvyl-6-hydroxy-3-cyclohexene-1-carboxylic-acid synthase [Coriobacteriia bacterium]|nr:2-succinyl-5-enolpyruvyl-6-hydroxy-3-cyclohexene-1-carboxylic-acid synthase [Coriobacteriia bacterium]